MTLYDNLKNQYDIEESEIRDWKQGNYINKPCPKCKRIRVRKCENGKHICEKCSWVIEDKVYR